jgi:hypothetical protein
VGENGKEGRTSEEDLTSCCELGEGVVAKWKGLEERFGKSRFQFNGKWERHLERLLAVLS